jgi:hypothetical protein
MSSAKPPKKPMSDARISGMIATGVLIFLGILTTAVVVFSG